MTPARLRKLAAVFDDLPASTLLHLGNVLESAAPLHTHPHERRAYRALVVLLRQQAHSDRQHPRQRERRRLQRQAARALHRDPRAFPLDFDEAARLLADTHPRLAAALRAFAAKTPPRRPKPPLLTRADGTPFPRPARSDYPTDLAFVHAVHAHHDAVVAHATEAFQQALRRELATRSPKPDQVELTPRFSTRKRCSARTPAFPGDSPNRRSTDTIGRMARLKKHQNPAENEGSDPPEDPPSPAAAHPAENAPWRPTPPPPGKHTRHFTPAETREHVALLEQLLLRGASQAVTTREMRARFGIGTARVLHLARRIREGWTREDNDRRATWRSQAIRRLERYILMAEGQRDPNNPAKWLERPNHAALARYMSLLADIQGTKEPLRIDVDLRVHESLAAVVANLRPEQVSEALDSYRENQRLAALWRAAERPDPPERSPGAPLATAGLLGRGGAP